MVLDEIEGFKCLCFPAEFTDETCFQLFLFFQTEVNWYGFLALTDCISCFPELSDWFGLVIVTISCFHMQA